MNFIIYQLVNLLHKKTFCKSGKQLFYKNFLFSKTTLENTPLRQYIIPELK